MSEVKYFMPPGEFFSLAQPVLFTLGARVIFRRFRSEKHESGMTLMSKTSNLGVDYVEGGYAKAYFSINEVPMNDRDWEFTDRAERSILELSGGRLLESCLELSTLRTFAKKTRASKLFLELSKVIESNCKKGCLEINGIVYPEIMYSESSIGYEMYTSLKSKSLRCVVGTGK